MIKERFTITQKEDYFYVRDEVNKKPMGMFEFKQDEFPVYFCFHKIIDLLNEQHEQIERLKRNFKALDEVKCEIAEENEQLKQQLDDLSFEFETQYKHHYDCRRSQSYADGTMLCSIHDEIDPESKVCKDFKGYW